MKRYVCDVVIDYENIHQTLRSRNFVFFSRLLKYIQSIKDECDIVRFHVYDVKTGVSFCVYSYEV